MSDISEAVDWMIEIEQEKCNAVMDAIKNDKDPAALIDQYFAFRQLTDKYTVYKPAPLKEYVPLLQYAAA
jgi:hypothetical protein